MSKKQHNIKSSTMKRGGLISANELIDRINRQKELTKEQKLEKLIDIGFKRIYGVKGESWENKFKRADVLSNIVEKDTNNGIYYRMKETIKRHI